MENNEIKLMNVCFGGVSIEVPQIWNVETEMYTEPDGRECAMIDITISSAQQHSDSNVRQKTTASCATSSAQT